MTLVLHGFKSSGKSTYGKKLAKKLQVPFYDTDALIESAFHNELKAFEIYQNYCEKVFRKAETQVIKDLKNEKSVIALGGSSLFTAENYQHLQPFSTFIFIDESLEVIIKRILSSRIPLFLSSQNPEESVRKEYDRRLAKYRAVEGISIKPCSSDPKLVVNSIVRRLDENSKA